MTKSKANNINEILVIHTWGMGDLILLTPVLRAVKILHPDLKISMLFFPRVAAIPLLNASYISDISFSEWKILSLLQTIIKMSKKRFFAVLFSSGVTHWKAWSFLLCLKSDRKIGEYRKYKLPGLSAYSRYDYKKSRTETNYNLFKAFLSLPDWSEAIGRKAELNFYPQFFLTQSNLDFADRFVKDNFPDCKFIIGVHPGCMAKNKFRRWPRMSFVETIRRLKANYPYEILIIAGPDELDVGEFIAEQTQSILLSNAGLSDVAAVIAKCGFFLNTDSGLGHIASCFGIRTLTIFGPGNEKQTAPFSDNSYIIRNDIACAPCVGKKKQKCEVECLKNLTPEQVYNRIVELVP